MTEQFYLAFTLLIVICGVAGIGIIVRARRKREGIYYWASGIAFLVAIAGVMVLFEQYILFFAMMILSTLLSFILMPEL